MPDSSRPPVFPAPDPNRSPFTRARSLAGSLCTTVQLFQALADTRAAVDLAGLEGTVGLLCAKALDLDPEQGRLLLPELGRVLAGLTALGGTLAERAPPAA